MSPHAEYEELAVTLRSELENLTAAARDLTVLRQDSAVAIEHVQDALTYVSGVLDDMLTIAVEV